MQVLRLACCDRSTRCLLEIMTVSGVHADTSISLSDISYFHRRACDFLDTYSIGKSAELVGRDLDISIKVRSDVFKATKGLCNA